MFHWKREGLFILGDSYTLRLIQHSVYLYTLLRHLIKRDDIAREKSALNRLIATVIKLNTMHAIDSSHYSFRHALFSLL